MTQTPQIDSSILLEDRAVETSQALQEDATIYAGTLEEEEGGTDTVEDSVVAGDLPIGRFKVVGDTLHLGDQRRISPICCSVFSTIEALCNIDGRAMDHDLVRIVWQKMIADGKVIAGVGAYGSDGTGYAVDMYNSKYRFENKKPFLRRRVEITPENMIKIFSQFNSPIVTGIRGSNSYFKDEQDDGKIQKDANKPGKLGHFIAFVVGNSQGVPQGFGIRAKYLEHYIDSKPFNVIEVDLSNMYDDGLLFNIGYYFIR